MARTEDWTRRGIRVFGVMPPAYGPRVALEDSLLGFDGTAFAAAFAAAGGTWLDTGRENYETYDGSHLTAPSAREFSRILARSLHERLED